MVRDSHTPPAVRPRLGKRRDITCLDPFDREPALAYQSRNVTGHMAAFERPMKERFSPLLPTLDGRFRREPVFEENEFPSRLEDPSDAPNGFDDSRNCAQTESAHHRVDGRGMRSPGRSRNSTS